MVRNIILALVFCVPVVALAHGTGGTYETTRDGYVIDIGYSPEIIDTSSQARFDFTAYVEADPTATTSVFTDVWVRINQGNQLHFAGNINRPEFGPTGFSTILGEPGEYEVFARFQADGESLVETSFPLTVHESNDTDINNLAPMVVGGVALLLGLALGFLLGRKRL